MTDDNLKLAGLFRGRGTARLKYNELYGESLFDRVSEKTPEWYSHAERLATEYNLPQLQKAFRIIRETKPDEAMFWTLLYLIRSREEGGICAFKEEIKSYILSQNPNLNPEKSWAKSINNSDPEEIFHDDGDAIYLKNLFRIEVELCDKLNSLYKKNPLRKFKVKKVATLSDEQNSILESVLKHSISLVSGGPGTGKTTLIKSILSAFLENGVSPEKIYLASPTGKAAKRLEESSTSIFNSFPDLNKPATLHRILGYKMHSGKFEFNEENPLPCEILIVDESSMCDIFLFHALLNALPNKENIQLVLIGDPDQLLSVNSGAIFSDLVDTGIHSYRLTKTFRQSEEGKQIKNLAELISANNFQYPYPTSDSVSALNGVSFIQTVSPEDLKRHLLQWKRLSVTSVKTDATPATFQILTPYNEGFTGVKQLNQIFSGTERIRERKKFKDGDKVICNFNLYDLLIFNGETGFIKFNGDDIYFSDPINNREIIISGGNLQYFELAEVISIHKSQGSEYDHVCLVLPPEESADSIMNKRLLYTAITRAKKSLTILGKLSVFESAANNQGFRRTSKMKSRLVL